MKEYLQSLGYKVEEIEKSTKYNAFSRFNFLDKTIVYFDLIGDLYLNNIYEKNYSTIKNEFKNVKLDLLFLPNLDFPKLDFDFIQYLFPHFSNYSSAIKSNIISKAAFHGFEDCTIALKDFSLYTKEYLELLNHFEYKGSIQSGFIVIYDSTIYIIEHTNLDYINGLKEPKENIIRYFNEINFELPDVFNSRYEFNFGQGEFTDKLEENLDEETKLKISQINEQLEEFKKSGTLLYILPLLKQTLHKYEDEIDLNVVSTIFVDENYNITLPYFNNMIVHLSHLTKAIYILFTKHPNGIDLNELYIYKNELKNIYLSVSNQENFDKINQSISDLLDPNSNAIYTHISRVKSAFYKLMDKFYADNYIITGSGYGSSFKFIPVLKTIEPCSFNDDDLPTQPF